MSAFRKTTKVVDEFEKYLVEAEAKIPVDNDVGQAVLSEEHNKALEWVKILEDIEAKMTVFKAKADEKDPDKKIYGPGMIKRVKALGVRVDELRPRMDHIVEAWDQAMKPVLEAQQKAMEIEKQEAAQRLAEEEEAEKKREEALRIRRLAETARRKAELIRKEEEKKKKEIEEKLRREQERKEYEEQKIRLKIEAERLKKAESMKPADALKLIRSSNGHLQAARVVMTLRSLVSNILNNPDQKMFRRIRKANKHIQSELLQYKGGEEFLISMGFRLRRIKTDHENDAKKVLKDKLITFYKTFAPHELQKVDVPRVVDFFVGPKEAQLWDKLRQKYGKSEEDLPTNYDRDVTGQLFYVMDEPPVNQASRWQKWFKSLEHTRALLGR